MAGAGRAARGGSGGAGRTRCPRGRAGPRSQSRALLMGMAGHAQRLQALDLGLNIVALQVEVHPFLGYLLVVGALEQHPDLGIRESEQSVDGAALRRQRPLHRRGRSRRAGAGPDSSWFWSSPCRRVPLPKVEREEMRFLTPAEVTTLADAIKARYRALVLVGALRWSAHRGAGRAAPGPRRPAARDGHGGRDRREVRGVLHIGPPKTRAQPAPR
jgi:hypothetical protein